MTPKNISTLPLSGYFFDPPEYEHAPGAPRLEVYLAEVSLPDQIIPRSLRLTIKDEDDLENLTLEHPWTQGREYSVALGCILLHGPEQIQIEAFTFGGELRVETQAAYTNCMLTIIEITSATNPIAP